MRNVTTLTLIIMKTVFKIFDAIRGNKTPISVNVTNKLNTASETFNQYVFSSTTLAIFLCVAKSNANGGVSSSCNSSFKILSK
ncbi:hypothetical protein LJC53_06305 [Bacteroidales bacterium OttesenSCG-928-C03]|nr:hypothetical protein [Bacteroidales bacterium OttesenSCG-928-C03]